MRLERLSPALGVKIHGVDLSVDLPPATWNEIYQAYLKYQLVIFGEQELSPKAFVNVANHFGTPTTNDDIRPMTLPGFPEIAVAEHDENRRAGADYWHADQTGRETMTTATLLHGKKIPGLGGDTLVSNMYKAFADLSPSMQGFLETLTAVHSEAKAFGTEFIGIRNSLTKVNIDPERAFASKPDVIRPLVLKHPETGNKSFYVSYPYLVNIRELSKSESEHILDFIYMHTQKQEYIYRHRWRENDLLIWDNRCTQHFGVSDYFPNHRLMHKITVN